MMKFSRVAASLAAVGALMVSVSVSAEAGDRHHRHGHKHCDKARVVAALKHMGFVSGEEIECKRRYIEVDDGIRHDGNRFDVKLDPVTLAVIHKEHEGKVRHR